MGPEVSDSHQNCGHDGRVQTIALGPFLMGGCGPWRLLQAVPTAPEPGSCRQSGCAPPLAAGPLRGSLQEAAVTSNLAEHPVGTTLPRRSASETSRAQAPGDCSLAEFCF